MASLLDEEFARRDQPPSRSSGAPGSLAERRFEYQQARDAMANEAKAQDFQRKEQEYQSEADNATERLGIAEKNALLSEKMAQIQERAAELKITEAANKADLTLKAMDDADTYWSEVGKLDPWGKDFAVKHADLKRRTKAADHVDGIQKRDAYLLGEREKANAYNMQFAPQPEKLGTVTTDESGAVKIVRPVRPGEEEAARHAKLEGSLGAFKDSEGRITNPDGFRAAVGELNAVKARLGYDPIDPTTGAVVPKAVAAPTLTTKDEFDALPSGATYIRGGIRYKKP